MLLFDKLHDGLVQKKNKNKNNSTEFLLLRFWRKKLKLIFLLFSDSFVSLQTVYISILEPFQKGNKNS